MAVLFRFKILIRKLLIINLKIIFISLILRLKINRLIKFFRERLSMILKIKMICLDENFKEGELTLALID